MTPTSAAGVLIVIIVGAILVGIYGGQVGEQKRQFYQCRLDAMRQHRLAADLNDAFNDAAVYVENCMGSMGFEIEYRPDDKICRIGDDHRRLLASCYAPIGRIARWMYHFEEGTH